jgi:hypothetical protein
MCIKTSCLWICENIAAYPHDHANYIGYNYWVPVVTPGGPGNDPDRAVFTTTGSVNLSPVANPPTLPDYEAAAVVNHFTGRSSNYQDAWLGILVALPNWYPFYSPGTQTFQVESSAPFVWLDGVQKGGDNHYGGWSIWNFGVGELLRTKDRDGKPNECMETWAHIGIKGENFQVVRVGYGLTVAGRVVPK